MSLEPVLVVNPASDLDLVAVAAEGLHDGASSPALLQVRLRTIWPDVVVRPRALSGEPRDVWYVYREGHWIEPDRAPRPEREEAVANVRD